MQRILQHPAPNPLGLTNPDGIAMFARLFGVKKGVRSAQDYRHAAPAELIGDVVGAVGIERPGGDGDQVCAVAEINRLELLVEEFDFPFRRRQGREIRERQRHNLTAADFEHRLVRLRAVIRRLND